MQTEYKHQNIMKTRFVSCKVKMVHPFHQQSLSFYPISSVKNHMDRINTLIIHAGVLMRFSVHAKKLASFSAERSNPQKKKKEN